MKRSFNILLYKIAYYTHIMSCAKIAKKYGVTCGVNCCFLEDPFKLFGTEPYLINIGNHVEITNGCRLITHDGSVWLMREKKEYCNLDHFGPIKIGNNVFIGANSIILPGTVIGDNYIIGAGSVVKGHLDSDSVYAGVPVKKIKSLNSFLEKILASPGTLNTKGLSIKQKQNIIQGERPEWFVKESKIARTL